MFINIHTHQSAGSGERAIVNLFRDFNQMAPGGFYSAGLHPWYLSADHEREMDLLKQYAAPSHVLAIGETGLDKACRTAWALQVTMFRLQIELAMEWQKPLIIHCVRAWNEVMEILQEYAVNVPVIFHGYQKGLALARQLTNLGYYLSFGHSLEQERNREVLRGIPVNQFFLETDDTPVPIARVYNYAAIALSIDLNTLDLQIQQNAKAVFGPSFIV